MRCDSDYHTHPQGHAIRPYTVELLQPWANRCRERRIESIAFTDHDRYHDGVDFDMVDRLREANPDLEILIGIEIDNDPVTSKAGLSWVEANWDRLDFVLGSVHYFPDGQKMFDGADQAQQLLDKGIELAFEEYREQLEIVIGRGNIDCLSHLDLVKIHALIPDSYDPAAFFTPILDRIRSAGLALEINTAGWRKKIGEQYPSEPILQAALKLGIPITISSDAHSYVQVGEDYDKLGLVADRLGLQKPTRYWRHRRRN